METVKFRDDVREQTDVIRHSPTRQLVFDLKTMTDEPQSRLTIRIAGNTSIPCVQVIASKGYTIRHYFLGNSPGDWDSPQWNAEKDGRTFSATSPEELLGLISMWETRGDAWRLNEGEGELYDQLVESAPIYDDDGNVVDR